MANVLSQEEIDALLGGLSEGQIDTKSKNKGGGVGECVPFDFTDQDRFLRSKLPTLETIHDRFSRLLRLSFSTSVRRTVEIQISNQSVCTFSDFSRSVEKPSSLHVAKVEPLRGSLLLVLPARLILTLVDLMFGGSGRQIQISPERDFTLIEQRLIRKMTEEVCRCYTESWSSVHPIHLQLVGSETNVQFINIAQANDPVHVVDCDVAIENSRSSLSICIPFATLEPIKDILRGVYVSDRSADTGSDGSENLRHSLLGSSVEMRGVLGSATVTGRDLLSMKPGDIIQLDEDFEHPIEVQIEGSRKFWGAVGAYKSERALQITAVADESKGNRP
jgi:flagellar motor switch protein FliM